MKFMNRLVLLSACFISSMSCLNALESSDDSEIRKVIQGYADSWNQKACVGFADGFTVDADFVNIFGMIFSGRDEIEVRHIKILQSFLKDSKLEILNVKLREAKPGVVIALVSWKCEGFRKPGSDINGAGESRDGVFTQVFINTDNKWEITASQNTLVNK